MPVVFCSTCRAELEVEPSDLGERVECPACRQTFVALQKRLASLNEVERVVRCDHCDGKVTVLEDDLGHRVECPLCHTLFRARTARAGRDRERPRYDPRWDEDDYEDRQYLIERAKRECRTAANALQIIGWIQLVLSPLGFFILLDGNAEVALVVMFISFSVFGLLLSVVQIVGGRQMAQAKNWGLSLIACIFGIAVGLLCGLLGIVGMVFGAMGIAKLCDKRVKRGFQLNNPNYDPDS
jgi:uncharacterized CHY-type Zn-finger protein